MSGGGKIQNALNSLTPERNREIGKEIEAVLKDELSYIVNKYIRAYSYAVYDTFGWTPEDLMQNVRVLLWKGLATFSDAANVKKTTYLNAILRNYFLTVSKKCKSKRNSQAKLTSVGEVYDDFEERMEEATDTIIASMTAETYKKFVQTLHPFEAEVFDLCFLIGHEPMEVAKMLGVSPRRVNTTVKFLRAHYVDEQRIIEDKEEEITYELEPDAEPPIESEA